LLRRTLIALTLALLAAPAGAQADFFPAEQVDGPSPDITAVGDLDISRDGNGALVYLKKDGATDHVFLSGLNGGFGPGVRIDNGLAPASTQPVVAASNEGRLAVAWVNDGSLFTAIRARDAQGFSAPALVAAGGVSNPSIDMSINGATYLSFTQGGNVRIARAERDSPVFVVNPGVVDIVEAADAGSGPDKRSRVAISADGTGLVVWGEDGGDGRTHVFARRVFEQRLSVAPQDLTLNEFEGRAAGGADRPELEMEDDSSYAQVVFRQGLAGGARTIARRLVGSAFDPPVGVDGGGESIGGRVDITGRGEGLLAATGAGGEAIGSTVFNNAVTFTGRFDSTGSAAPAVIPAIGENEDGVMAWIGGAAGETSVRAKYIDGVERPKVTPEAVLSTGLVDPEGGFDAVATRAGDAIMAFMQGTGPERRLVAAFYDRPPSRPVGSTTTRPRRPGPLKWAASLDLLGSPTYTVLVDGRPIGQTQGRELVVDPTVVPEGEHQWQISATDHRGQTQVSRTRPLRIDGTPPTITASFRRKQRVLTITPRAGDPDGADPSGLSRIVVDLGNGVKTQTKGRLTYRYPRLGTYEVVVTAIDRAGNATELRRRIRIGK